MADIKEALQQKILAFITQTEMTENEKNQKFNELAMTIFNYQFKYNQPYREYAKLKRKTPLTINQWQYFPLIPIQAYKYLQLTTTNPSEAADVFLSSGTTNPTQKSHHYLSNLLVWEQSMISGFKKYVLPNQDKITIFALFPDQLENPNSSLSRYVSTAIKNFGTQNSHVFFRNNQMDYDHLITALEQANSNNEPILLLGASFSYVHLLNHLKQLNKTFSLSNDSIIFDTGGFKGKSEAVSMTDLYTNLMTLFGVKRQQIINMYGMTEISSQCYDRNILDAYQEQQIYYTKKTPHWVNIQILNPETLMPVKIGERGLIAYYDLANWDSCLAILTEDMAVQDTTGFTLLGRIKGSEAKGCSIAMDELLNRREIK